MDSILSVDYTNANQPEASPVCMPLPSILEGDEIPMKANEDDTIFPQTGDPWEKCYSTVKKYDDDLCEGWRDEVDKLLIFAGLFSATVTAFLLESYAKLSEDPSEKTNWLLEQLLLQAHGANTGNTTTSAQPPTRPQFKPAAMDIRLNVFWFLSLSLSLATVVLAILCIQWLREYQRAAPLDPKDAISLRQIRYQGFVTWRVPAILLSLPVLLHLSLILFFVGLLDLLWNLNHIVAAFVTVVAGFALIFIIVTTLLPGLQLLLMTKEKVFDAQCPYKSPQALGFHILVTEIVRFRLADRIRIFHTSLRRNRYVLFFENKDWVDFDVSWRKMRKVARKTRNLNEITDVGRGLVWIEKHLGQSTDVITAIYSCVRALASRDAFHIISRLSENIKDHLTSQEVSESTARLSEQGRQELAALLFLERQTHTFPQLDDGYFRLLVHFLATQIRDAGLTQINGSPLSKSGDQLTIVLPFLRLRIFSMYDQPKDLVLEYLRHFKVLASNGLLNTLDLQKSVWDLLQEVLLPRSATTKNDQAVKDEDIAQASCDVMKAFVDDLLRRVPQKPPLGTPSRSPISSSDKAYTELVEVSGVEQRPEIQSPSATEPSIPNVEVIKRCAIGALQAFPSNRKFGDLRVCIFPVLESIEDRMDAYGGAWELLDRVDAQRWSQMMTALRPATTKET